MSNRVFSYNNWNLFCGFDPMYTEADRIKLQAIDGTKVTTVGDQCLLTRNPLGGIGLIPVCATRQFNESDISFEQMINNSELIAGVYRNMVAQAVNISTNFHTIAYLDDIKHEAGAFALVSVCKYDVESSIIYYKVHQILPVASVNKYVRAEMVMRKLPSMGRFIPNGFSADDPDVAVFSMSPDVAINCMIDVNPNMHFGLTSADKEIINQYIQNTLEDIDDDESDDIADSYCDLCKKALEACASPDPEPVKARKQYRGHKISRNSSTVDIAHRYLALQEQYMAAQDNISSLQTKVDRIRDPQKTLQEVKDEFERKYSYLVPEALTALIEGEASYRDHEFIEEFSFVEVIRSYALVVEVQLRHHLEVRRPDLLYGLMTFGDVIKAIENSKIVPYYRSVSRYRTINGYRIDSSHDAIGSKKIAEEIRTEFFDRRMLEWLK